MERCSTRRFMRRPDSRSAEALCLGVPLVCLDHGGPAEIVRWWPSGHVALVLQTARSHRPPTGCCG